MRQTLELAGPLAGKHVEIEDDELTFGFLEDVQSGDPTKMLDALASVVVGGDLPRGADRNGLRRLKPGEIKAVVDAIGGSFRLSE